MNRRQFLGAGVAAGLTAASAAPGGGKLRYDLSDPGDLLECQAPPRGLGPGLDPRGNASNPKGFFENEDITPFNNRLLRFLHSSWDNPIFDGRIALENVPETELTPAMAPTGHSTRATAFAFSTSTTGRLQTST